MKKIKYQFITEVNHGTEEEPNIVQTLRDKEIQCSDDVFEANLAIAKSEAYNGEVTVEKVPMTESEARAERDKLLTETDWIMMPDSPVTDACREAYRVYRQALRDVPQQENFPTNIIWPEKPEIVQNSQEV